MSKIDSDSAWIVYCDSFHSNSAGEVNTVHSILGKNRHKNMVDSPNDRRRDTSGFVRGYKCTRHFHLLRIDCRNTVRIIVTNKDSVKVGIGISKDSCWIARHWNGGNYIKARDIDNGNSTAVIISNISFSSEKRNIYVDRAFSDLYSADHTIHLCINDANTTDTTAIEVGN